MGSGVIFFFGVLKTLVYPFGNGPLCGLRGADPVHAKLAYAMPDFANPTGQSLSIQEREALLAGAEAMTSCCSKMPPIRSCAIAARRCPSLLALDLERRPIDESRVIYCGTFSKTIIPGLRAGWVVAAKPVIQQMGLLKQASDFHTSPLTQMVLTEVASRLPQSHIAMLCETYGARCEAMLAALSAHMPPGVSWTTPEGGMFIWATLPDTIDAAELLAEAIAAGVAFVPGAAFFPDNPKANTLRLNFTACGPAAIRDGIARLGQLIALRLGR